VRVGVGFTGSAVEELALRIGQADAVPHEQALHHLVPVPRQQIGIPVIGEREGEKRS
jgi:hypothetical protein